VILKGPFQYCLSFAAYAVCLSFPPVQGEPYSIDWFKIAPVAAASQGGNFRLSGVMAQPDAGAMVGGNFALKSGFLSVVTVLQTPGAPTLTVTRRAPNAIEIGWAFSSTGFALEQSTDLRAGTWQPVTEPVLGDGTRRFIAITPREGQLFYRLVKK
jgi:hypothetical protein